MDNEALQAAARRYIKHQVRYAVLPTLTENHEVILESMETHGEAVEKFWFDAIRPLDLTDPHVKDQLSRIVNEAFVEAIREVRESVGDQPGINRVIATFHATFNIDEMLPQVFA